MSSSSTPLDTNPAFATNGGAAVIPSQLVSTPSGVRTLCGACGMTFGRPQEFRRHVDEMHSLTPRRQCPFCSHEWTRVGKIKAHLAEAHHDVLSAEVLQGIGALRGRAMVEFLNNYEYLRAVIAEIYGPSPPLFPSQT